MNKTTSVASIILQFQQRPAQYDTTKNYVLDGELFATVMATLTKKYIILRASRDETMTDKFSKWFHIDDIKLYNREDKCYESYCPPFYIKVAKFFSDYHISLRYITDFVERPTNFKTLHCVRHDAHATIYAMPITKPEDLEHQHLSVIIPPEVPIDSPQRDNNWDVVVNKFIEDKRELIQPQADGTCKHSNSMYYELQLTIDEWLKNYHYYVDSNIDYYDNGRALFMQALEKYCVHYPYYKIVLKQEYWK